MNKFLSIFFRFSVSINSFLALGGTVCLFSNKNKTVQDGIIQQAKVMITIITNFKIMNTLLLPRILSLFIGIILTFCPVSLGAIETDSPLENSLTRSEETSGEMTEKQMNDLFGEDPYLGQTSYLQSPDGFSQRETSK